MENIVNTKDKNPQGIITDWLTTRTDWPPHKTFVVNGQISEILHHECPHSIFRLWSPSLICYLQLKQNPAKEGTLSTGLYTSSVYTGTKRYQRNLVASKPER